MFKILPITGEADTVQTVTIGEESYNFRMRWNTKEEAWYCYFGEVGSEYTVKFKVVIGFDLLKPYSGLNGVPPGVLYCYDYDDGDGRVNRGDLAGTSSRFRLIYMD